MYIYSQVDYYEKCLTCSWVTPFRAPDDLEFSHGGKTIRVSEGIKNLCSQIYRQHGRRCYILNLADIDDPVKKTEIRREFIYIYGEMAADHRLSR